MLAALASASAFFEDVEARTYDWRVRLVADGSSARRDIVLVLIDETSIRKLAPEVGRWPWPRLVHAQLINYLARGPAKVIGYDILFGEPDRTSFTLGGETWTGAESDAALAEAIRRGGNVVMIGDVSVEVAEETRRATGAIAPPDTGYRVGELFETKPGIQRRSPAWPPARARSATTCSCSTATVPCAAPCRSCASTAAPIPSLPLAVAAVAAGVAPGSVSADASALHFAAGGWRWSSDTSTTPGEPVEPVHRALVNFRGPAAVGERSTFDAYSFYDLFYSEQQILAGEKPFVDPGGLQGPDRARRHDRGRAARRVHRARSRPGQDARRGDPRQRRGQPARLGLRAGARRHGHQRWPTRLAGVRRRASPACCSASGPASARAALVAGGAAGRGGRRSSGEACGCRWPGPSRRRRWRRSAASPTSTSWKGARSAWSSGSSRGSSRPDVFAHLMADPSRARLGGERREMTVLFSDIRGFTTLTEAGRPEEVVQQLNEFFSRMVEVDLRPRRHARQVRRRHGDGAVRRAAGRPGSRRPRGRRRPWPCRRALDGLNARWAREGRPPLDIGIGVNTGEMVAGIIGAETIMSYTVIGDAVNLGARLESLNKEYGTHIIISERHTLAAEAAV